MSTASAPQLDRLSRFSWIKHLQVGDVVRTRSGKLRIIRAVSHWSPTLGGTAVTFTIQRTSWTRRCYTVMNGSDLATQGYSKTGARAKLNHEFDRAVENEFGHSVRLGRLTPEMVRGIP
jgi:hypothetical protein